MRVLLVDGDLATSYALQADLKTEGCQVEQTETGEDALSLLRHYEFDLMLVNLSLPDMEGATLIGHMRAANRDMPVLGLTRAPGAAIRLRALSAGADDVVHRQIELAELVARMNAILRRSRGYSQSVLRLGALSLNLEHGTVFAKEVPVPLTRREFDILKTLMLRKGMVMTKEALLSALYGGHDEPESKIIDVFICKIRKKLVQAGVPDVITTVWGRGYSVREIAGDPETPRQLPIGLPAERGRVLANA